MSFDPRKIFSPVTSAVSSLTGGLTGSLFGDVTGEEKTAAQAAENVATREFIERQAEQARGDVLRLFPAAEEARQLGTQGALDIFGQTIPQQLGLIQRGSVGAQQALTQGLPQILAALRGTPIDLSQLQPQALGFDPSFAQQTLPQFQPTTSLFPQKSSDVATKALRPQGVASFGTGVAGQLANLLRGNG